MKNVDTCRLCASSDPLKNSHIITGSLFAFVRDKTMNNRFYKIGTKSEEIVQDGPKEYLLCNECEQKIGRYEKYYKEAVHLSRYKIEIIHDNNIVITRNLDYGKIKLFLLSIL